MDLLLRVYFYEFGRFDDLFNMFLDAMVKKKWLRKQSKKLLQDSIYEAFKGTFKTRNLLTHLETTRTGQDYFDLFFYQAASEFSTGKDGRFETKKLYLHSLAKISEKHVKHFVLR